MIYFGACVAENPSGAERLPTNRSALDISMPALVLLFAGLASLAVPTFKKIAEVSWVSEQGAHGPIVLAIALWLLWRSKQSLLAKRAPGNAFLGFTGLLTAAAIYIVANIAGSVTIESFAFYAMVLSVFFLLVGSRAMLSQWFPFAYFLFVLPPPGSLVAWATQPLRLEISEIAVNLFSLLGYPAAREGLQIFIGQYVLEVKAACGGLNSMLSLTAIGMFYVYATRRMTAKTGISFFVLAIAFAIIANFVRVCLLMAIAYHFGAGAAEGFLHQFAGMVTFAIALFGVMGVANFAERWSQRKVNNAEVLK